jgi:hypothetical protein
MALAEETVTKPVAQVNYIGEPATGPFIVSGTKTRRRG